MSEGKYTVFFKTVRDKNEQTDSVYFYVRKNKYDFACEHCGRSLELTQNELISIFPNSKKINAALMKTFNIAFKKSGFKTCNHIAHFLAQLKLESGGLTRTTEGYKYYLHRMLEVFNGNEGTKFWYKQDFWDNKTYLKYVSLRVYEKMDEAKYDYSVDSINFEKFVHKTSKDTITVPKDYEGHSNHSPTFNGYTQTKGKGYYKKISLSTKQQEENGKRLLNAAYSGMNGNSKDTTASIAEGFLYRGRGFIQVTGKSNYVDAQKTCKDKFDLNFDFVTNPSLMENDTIAVWASMAWFIKNIRISDLDTENADNITYKVNKAGLEKGTRKQYYEAIKKEVFNCTKP